MRGGGHLNPHTLERYTSNCRHNVTQFLKSWAHYRYGWIESALCLYFIIDLTVDHEAGRPLVVVVIIGGTCIVAE